nr:winged helix-turn-helix domain-containing protein [Nannocystis pusilla]
MDGLAAAPVASEDGYVLASGARRRRPVAADRRRGRALGLLLRDGAAWSAQALADHAGVSRRTAQRALQLLVERGVVVRTGKGKNVRYTRPGAPIASRMSTRPRPGRLDLGHATECHDPRTAPRSHPRRRGRARVRPGRRRPDPRRHLRRQVGVVRPRRRGRRLRPDHGHHRAPLRHSGAGAGTAWDGERLDQLAGGEILVIDPSDGQRVRRLPSPGKGEDSGMAWSDSCTWVGQCYGARIHKVDAATGEVVKTLTSDRFVTGVTCVDGQLGTARPSTTSPPSCAAWPPTARRKRS